MKRKYKPGYTITRTEAFIKQCQEIRKNYDRFQQLLDAVDWALQRKPHSFSNVSGDYYLLKTKELPNRDFPRFKILYLILEEEEKIILINIDDE